MSNALAVIFEQPQQIALAQLALDAPTSRDVVVDIDWTGISTGTEKLLFTGRMPEFPGMGYPLVPGYESVGTIVEAGAETAMKVGQRVFVPGARCFGPVRGLFGGAASRLVTAASRVLPLSSSIGEEAVLFALAATAWHARAGVAPGEGELIVGHGVLGRLLARLAVLAGGEPPVVWEKNPRRATGALGYVVTTPDEDARRDYRRIFDVSGDSTILDSLVQRLAPGGEIVLAGFYESPLAFQFPPAFMREARIRVAAQWRDGDLSAIHHLVEEGRLSLEGLITHRNPAAGAESAYRVAFGDASCLKMALDWRMHS